jgi:hypothetical protein
MRHRVRVEFGRVEVSALHLTNQTEDCSVAEVLLPLQCDGKVEKECITACHRQRASRIEDSGEAGRRSI